MSLTSLAKRHSPDILPCINRCDRDKATLWGVATLATANRITEPLAATVAAAAKVTEVVVSTVANAAKAT